MAVTAKPSASQALSIAARDELLANSRVRNLTDDEMVSLAILNAGIDPENRCATFSQTNELLDAAHASNKIVPAELEDEIRRGDKTAAQIKALLAGAPNNPHQALRQEDRLAAQARLAEIVETAHGRSMTRQEQEEHDLLCDQLSASGRTQVVTASKTASTDCMNKTLHAMGITPRDDPGADLPPAQASMARTLAAQGIKPNLPGRR